MVQDAAVLPRHPLLAEAATADLATEPEQTRRLAGLLAQRARSAGRLPLAARALALAGDRDGALECALAAVGRAERHDERAALLRLAAECAPPADARELTARAVEELVVAAEFAQAATLVDQLPDRTDAHWLVLVGRVRWETGDDEAALAAYEAALADTGAGMRDHLVAQCEHARAILLGVGDKDRGLTLARAAYDAALAAGVEVARALGVLGTAEHFSGGDGCLSHLSQAVELARTAGDVQVELTSANNLVASHETVGHGVEAYTLAERYAERAAQLRLGGWQHQMTAMALNARMHQGDYDRVLGEIPDLLTRVAQRRTRDQLEITLALALVDLGRGGEAIERVEAALTRSVDDHYGRQPAVGAQRGDAVERRRGARSAGRRRRRSRTWRPGSSCSRCSPRRTPARDSGSRPRPTAGRRPTRRCSRRPRSRAPPSSRRSPVISGGRVSCSPARRPAAPNRGKRRGSGPGMPSGRVSWSRSRMAGRSATSAARTTRSTASRPRSSAPAKIVQVSRLDGEEMLYRIVAVDPD